MQSWVVREEEAHMDDKDFKREPRNVEDSILAFDVLWKEEEEDGFFALDGQCKEQVLDILMLVVGVRGWQGWWCCCWKIQKNGRGSSQFLNYEGLVQNPKLWILILVGGRSEEEDNDEETLRNESYESF